jgi:small nuclear ribonucleoprotein (snRNP)-like protein
MIHKYFFIAYLLLSCLDSLHAQGSDMVLLKKKNNKTLKKYLAETPINMITKNGERINGVIKKIDRDSMFINTYVERAAYTMWGPKFWDTLSIALIKVHCNEVGEIVKPRAGLGIIRNGYLFMAGGLSYAALHLGNALIANEPIDGSILAKAGAVALGGMILKKTYRSTVKIGKRYRLQYIPLK